MRCVKCILFIFLAQHERQQQLFVVLGYFRCRRTVDVTVVAVEKPGRNGLFWSWKRSNSPNIGCCHLVLCRVNHAKATRLVVIDGDAESGVSGP